MVKILPDGEIVADDDPRLQSTNSNVNQRRHPQQPNIPSTHGSPGNASSSSSSPSSWSFGLGSPAEQGATGRGGIGTPTNVGGGGRGDNGAGAVESITVFDLINEKMIEAGFPRLNLGPYPVEPIAVVGTCFALLLFGLPGLILSLGLFFVVKFSRHGVPTLNDFVGGRRIEGGNEEMRRDGGGGRGGGGESSRGETPARRRSPEEEKWGAGQRLGGR